MTRRVVVTGLGVVCPVGLDRETTWQSLIAGKSGIDHISLFDAEGFESRIAGEVRGFDPTAHMDRKKAARMDRFAQFACVASLEAKAQAGLDFNKTDAARVAALIGSGVGGIMTLSEQYNVLKQKGPNRVSPFLIPMMLSDLAAGNVSIMLGAKGPNFSPVSACATGSDAIGEAFEMIRRGAVDAAFAGGTEAAICPIAVAGFNSCMALSKRNDEPQKASRPFDAERDGFVLGEGAGVLFMESLEHAEARGSKPIAEVIGYASTSDAYHITQPAPEGSGAAQAIRLAMVQAGLGAKDIDYINAHGTSTPLNDKLETAAVKSIFGEHACKIPMSSTKSMTGHLLGAAGGVEAAIAVLAIERSAIPPTINLEHPDPECDLDYVPNSARAQRVRTAMSTNMGFGGHNACLIFKEFQA